MTGITLSVTFASRALAPSETLLMNGKLLGYSQVNTTARYAHLAKDKVHDSAPRVAESLAADPFGNDRGPDSMQYSMTSTRMDCKRHLFTPTENQSLTTNSRK